MSVYLELTEIIEDVENNLKSGSLVSVNPESAIQTIALLGGWLSYVIGILEQLEAKEARYFNTHRDMHKSDTATRNAFKTSEHGIKLDFWKTRKERIEVLIGVVSKVYYHSREEFARTHSYPKGIE